MHLNTVKKSARRRWSAKSNKRLKKKIAIKAFSLLKFTHRETVAQPLPLQHSQQLLGVEIDIRKLRPITHLHVT